MWFRVLLFACLCIQSAILLKCRHYEDKPKGNSPCKKAELVDGVCNTTQTCKPHEQTERVHCYTTWKNESGNITIAKQGCFMEAMHCIDKVGCIADTVSREYYFCCCNGDFCNLNFSYIPSHIQPSPRTPDDPVPTSSPSNSSFDLVMTAVYTLIGITVVASAVAVIYVVIKKRLMEKKSDVMIVDPCGPEPPDLLPPSQAESKLPELIELKARGRFGCVWKAQLLDSYVAVKIFYASDKLSWQNEQDIFNTDMVNEHENVLHCITAASRGVGVETEYWLITDFHELGSLADYMKTNTFTLANALRFLESMASGLSFLHEDILCRNRSTNTYKPAIAHRDFKSKNVLITNKLTAVIADFGLAVKFVPGESTGESHGQVGTRRYMAPEILEGAINFQRDAFLRIDMYAFALVMWEVVTRCADAIGGPASIYYMPYEEELGQHPSLEEMQEYVVDKKERPKIKFEWRRHQVFDIICDTIEECWDHDAEARLSAGCVQERIRDIQQKMITPPEIPIQSNNFITNASSLTSPLLSTEMQNQINSQRNAVGFINSRNHDEESNLLNTDSSLLTEFDSLPA